MKLSTPLAEERLIWFPMFPFELFRVLSHFCLETWSSPSFPESEGVAVLGDSYELGAGRTDTSKTHHVLVAEPVTLGNLLAGN